MNAHNLNVFICSNNAHCEGRGVDAARLLNYFTANGCRILDKPDQADFIIIFTCAFSNAFEDYYLDLIRRFQLHTYKGEIIVTGCLPAIAPEKLARLFQGKAFATCELHTIDNVFPWFETGYAQVPDANACYYSSYVLPDPVAVKVAKATAFARKALGKFEFSSSFFQKGFNTVKTEITNRYRRSRSTAVLPAQGNHMLHGIRISTGCLGSCTYCGIRKAIGKLKSKPPDVCLAEYKRLLEKGHHRVVIGSEDSGAYGRDIDTTLPDLLENLRRIDHGYNTRWFLTSFKPIWLLKFKSQILNLAAMGKISHLECPVQSGSERILRLMKRPSSLKALSEVFTAITQASPDIKLMTHIIVGFPTETDQDFQETMSLLRQHRFHTITLNPYDNKPQSTASKMGGQVTADTIAARYEFVQRYMLRNNISAFRSRITSRQP